MLGRPRTNSRASSGHRFVKRARALNRPSHASLRYSPVGTDSSPYSNSIRRCGASSPKEATFSIAHSLPDPSCSIQRSISAGSTATRGSAGGGRGVVLSNSGSLIQPPCFAARAASASRRSTPDVRRTRFKPWPTWLRVWQYSRTPSGYRFASRISARFLPILACRSERPRGTVTLLLKTSSKRRRAGSPAAISSLMARSGSEVEPRFRAQQPP